MVKFKTIGTNSSLYSWITIWFTYWIFSHLFCWNFSGRLIGIDFFSWKYFAEKALCCVYMLTFILRFTHLGYLYRNPNVFNRTFCLLMIFAVGCQILSQTLLPPEVNSIWFKYIRKTTILHRLILHVYWSVWSCSAFLVV